MHFNARAVAAAVLSCISQLMRLFDSRSYAVTRLAPLQTYFLNSS